MYEIYYAADHQSSNEYLCTVRCGVATRDEEVLHTPDVGEVNMTNQKGDGKESDEKRTKSEGSASTNEDGWVEVKASDSPRFDNGNSPPANSGTKTGGSIMVMSSISFRFKQRFFCAFYDILLLHVRM